MFTVFYKLSCQMLICNSVRNMLDNEFFWTNFIFILTTYHIFSLVYNWSKYIMWLNILALANTGVIINNYNPWNIFACAQLVYMCHVPAKAGGYPVMFSNFQTWCPISWQKFLFKIYLKMKEQLFLLLQEKGYILFVL